MIGSRIISLIVDLTIINPVINMLNFFINILDTKFGMHISCSSFKFSILGKRPTLLNPKNFSQVTRRQKNPVNAVENFKWAK